MTLYQQNPGSAYFTDQRGACHRATIQPDGKSLLDASTAHTHAGVLEWLNAIKCENSSFRIPIARQRKRSTVSSSSRVWLPSIEYMAKTDFYSNTNDDHYDLYHIDAY